MKQGDKLQLTVIDYGNKGEGIAKHDGRVIFLPFAIKGERVAAKITYVKKDCAFAEVTKIIEPSPYRVKPVCNRFARCGGCDIMHIDYSEQLRLKQGALYNTLRKCLKQPFIVDECVRSPEAFGYRNKIILPFGTQGGKTVVGFYSEGTHKVVPITKCFLHGEWASKLIDVLLTYARDNNISVYDEIAQTGILRHAAARYLNGKLSLTLVVNAEYLPNRQSLIALLKERFGEYCLYISSNRMHNNVVMGDSAKLIEGQPLSTEIDGIHCELHPLSFLQVNDGIREAIYRRVIDTVIQSESSAVIDAYAGVGLLGAMLAKRGLAVFNIEIVKQAVQDAAQLAEVNGLTHLITNIQGDAAEELPKLFAYFGNTYPRITVILDPPRKGCSRAVLDALNELASCNEANDNYDIDAPFEDSSQKHKKLTYAKDNQDVNAPFENSSLNRKSTCGKDNQDIDTPPNQTPIFPQADAAEDDDIKETLSSEAISRQYDCDLVEGGEFASAPCVPYIDIASDKYGSLESPAIDIIYISCNPATLARDLALLSPAYRPTSITPYDMFPHTRHLETVVLMSKVTK